MRVTAVAVLALLLSCARIEPPPGGPPDAAPPQLVATRPDSLARLPDFGGDVEFRFDEIVSEGGSPNNGTGSGDLEKLVILSPTTRVPKVRWHRDHISVRPNEGWKPNRVYRVELLPGVTDLRRNRSVKGGVITFTTGAPLPTATITGLVVDWTTSRPAPAALVEALLLPDSLPYRGLADSSGRIVLGPLPPGQYVVKGILDANRNARADGREAYDSVRLVAGKTDAGELWAFEHDTVSARIKAVTTLDSLSASVEFTQMLDPRQRLKLDAVTVRVLPDSTPVRVLSLLPKPVDDSLHPPAPPAVRLDSTARDSARRDSLPRVRRDSLKPGLPPARRDSLRQVKPPAQRDSLRPPRPGIQEIEGPGRPGQRPEAKALTTRPPLFDRLVLRVAAPWKPEGRYEVEVRGVRNVTGVSGNARGVLSVPKPTPRDTLAPKATPKATPRDSLAPRPTPKPAPKSVPLDSLKRRLPQKSP